VKQPPSKPPAPPLTVDTPLEPKEQTFVAEYLVDLNGAAAARRAGYSDKSAAVLASRLLTKVNIAAAVQKAFAERAVRTGLTADRVLAELEALAFSNIAHYVVDIVNGKVDLADGAPRDAMRAVASITHKRIPIGEHDHIDEVTLKLWDKPGMLRLAGQHLGIEGFRTRVELTGKNGKPIEIKQTEIDLMTDEQLRTRVLVLLEQL
jgi:phage terminase small subunit